MKILAIEKEVGGVDWSSVAQGLLAEEARHVFQLYLSDSIREIYFNEEKCAVLILECENLEQARALFDDFPLVKSGLLDFHLMELRPYTGYERILK